MSSFDNLWDAYTKTAEAHQQSKENCFGFIPDFISRLLQALDWPTEQAFLRKTEKEKFVEYKDARKSLEKFLAPTTPATWQFELQLVLWKKVAPTQGLYPLKLVIPISVSKDQDDFGVTVTTSEQGAREFKIRQTGADQFQDLYKFLLSAMLQRVQHSIHWEMEVEGSDEPLIL
ncbi:hypothetical protein NDA01_26790 [Trichocoleus desertorum AS-A10]|uniref:hypothetical protein n=1 Tax=Trichocoleus desertorum TaxID=1481672 RepID=UPI003297537B